MPKINILVAVDENHIEQILEVAQHLRSTGMHVEQILDRLGVITGSCDSDKMPEISQIAGVSHIEVEREYQLPPPESDLQ
jgi:hypothetical protein